MEQTLSDAIEPQQAWYFTFGLGYDLSDAFVVVYAPTETEARERFVAARWAAGLNPRKGWSSVYSAAEFARLRHPPVRLVAIETPAFGED